MKGDLIGLGDERIVRQGGCASGEGCGDPAPDVRGQGDHTGPEE